MSRMLVAVLAALAVPAFAQLPTGAWRTDFSKHSIPLAELVSTGANKDGIPPIDAPKFVTPESAAAWLAPDEPVLTVSLNGEDRAYPLQILIWHLLVNDPIGSTPVLVSLSVLCNTAAVYDRRLAGSTYTFGFSGAVRNSNLIVYDRQTESLWQQLTGNAVAGSLTGAQLTRLPSAVVPFRVFRQTYPNGKVLSRHTGMKRAYGTNPYAKFLSPGRVLFPVSLPGPLPFPPTDPIVVVQSNGATRAYSASLLAEHRVLTGRLAGTPFVIFSTRNMLDALDAPVIADSRHTIAATVFSPTLNGRTLTFYKHHGIFFDKQTHSRWNLLGVCTSGPLAGQRLYPLTYTVSDAFAWLAFYPGTPVMRPVGPGISSAGEYLWPLSDSDMPPSSRAAWPPPAGSIPQPPPQ
jgi:hypothetical protein